MLVTAFSFITHELGHWSSAPDHGVCCVLRFRFIHMSCLVKPANVRPALQHLGRAWYGIRHRDLFDTSVRYRYGVKGTSFNFVFPNGAVVCLRTYLSIRDLINLNAASIGLISDGHR